MKQFRYDTFCSKETTEIKNAERRCSKLEESKNLNKLLFLMAALFFCSCLPSIAPCENPSVLSRLFPDTWTCGKCGYSNYEGINNCGQCGNGK